MDLDRRAFLHVLGGAVALALGRPGWARPGPGALQVHRATRNTLRGAIGARLRGLGARPTRFKAYRGRERISLPPLLDHPTHSLAQVVRGEPPPSRFGDAPLSLAELGRLLYLTNGVTRRRAKLLLRAAPSAGALYAGEVYVVAERVSGLPPGVYSYAVADHDLIRLREGSFADELARTIERPEEIANAPAVVLLSNVFRRYTRRYANRGYRYALIDSGHIGENLRLAARAADLGERAVLRFHDARLNALLEVDGRGEAVCALHAVGTPAALGPAPRMRNLVEKGGDSSRSGVIQRYHETTELVEGGDAGTPAANPLRATSPAPTSRALPVATAPATPVDALIGARRSALRFTSDPISAAELSFVLEMADGHAALRRAPGVDLYVAVHRVRELAPGLYLYVPARRRLESQRVGDLRRPLAKACLGQEKAASAAAGILMVGRIRAAVARAGERSYRDLLIESGAIGERVYLGAVALGLAARNLAAFLDDELNDLLGLDGADAAVLHLTMLGRED